MVRHPASIRRASYTERHPQKRARIAEENRAASDIENYLIACAREQEGTLHEYLYTEVAHATGYSVEAVTKHCGNGKGANLAISILKPGRSADVRSRRCSLSRLCQSNSREPTHQRRPVSSPRRPQPTLARCAGPGVRRVVTLALQTPAIGAAAAAPHRVGRGTSTFRTLCARRRHRTCGSSSSWRSAGLGTAGGKRSAPRSAT
jgi:hypothetical protein